MEYVWNYIFSEKLKIDCCEHPIILTKPACDLKSNREKIVQMFFEHFNFPG